MISTEDDASTANDDDAGSAGDFMAQILGAAGKKKGGKTSRKQQKELEFEQALVCFFGGAMHGGLGFLHVSCCRLVAAMTMRMVLLLPPKRPRPRKRTRKR